jgi:homoaconitase/3-isopropylmalate dehydratase large subunit
MTMSKKTNSNDAVFAAALAAVVVGVASLPLIATIKTERAKRKQIRINRDAEIADIRYAKDIVLAKIQAGDYDSNIIRMDIEPLMTDFEFYRLTHRFEE